MMQESLRSNSGLRHLLHLHASVKKLLINKVCAEGQAMLCAACHPCPMVSSNL